MTEAPDAVIQTETRYYTNIEIETNPTFWQELLYNMSLNRMPL